MCGIAGFYGFRDDNLIKKFSHELAHRGPDGEGYDIDAKVTLLNRRLAIIDRATGDQPIFNEDKTISIVFVGEIYNYRELTALLKKAGHVFSTKSDTEMVVHSYEEWGEKSFDKFNGMFTFALYDKKKKKLILARDHFGIKPLYYSCLDTLRVSELKIIFSSEIKPLIYSGLIKKKPNDRVIYRYLKNRIHDDGRETFFSGIYRLLPGEMLIINNSGFRIQSYTNIQNELLDSKGNKKVGKKEVEKFKAKLYEAIKLRLISEVSVGSCLSGGLDSSTVVAVVNKLLKDKVKEAESVGKIQRTFSAIFPNQSNDEEKYIDSVIEKVNHLKSYKIEPRPEEFFKELEDFVKTQEEPTISTGPYAQYKVMELAHGKITVALDGQGSDEMLAGYLPYYFVYLQQLYLQKKYALLLKESLNSMDVLVKYSWDKLLKVIGVKSTVNPLELLNQNFAARYSTEKFLLTNSNLKKRLVEDIFKNSLQPLLRYEDKNAMHFSIEGRVPFLDFNLLRYLFSLDDTAIIKNGWNKYILRESTKDILPPLVSKRRNKIGFTTPEYEWFMRMKNKIYSLFLSESFAKRKYFNQPQVLESFQQFIAGKVDDTLIFWRLVNVEIWLRVFFDRPLDNEEKKADSRKKISLKVGRTNYSRYPVKTDLFKKGDNIPEKITSELLRSNIKIEPSEKWFVVVSEKIVAIAQGRSYFIWDIKPGFFANALPKFVTKTPAGIGLGSPWTMQLAINEDGLPRILLAALLSFLTKPFGIKGLFYRVVSSEVASIDGPTEYSLYPSNVSAKLGPKDPQKVSAEISSNLQAQISKLHLKSQNFFGVAIIDANDLGQKVLGNSTHLENSLIEKIMSDNPMGQSDEQTPLVIVTKE